MKPQSLMLSFLGIHVLDRRVAVFSGSVIDVFARVRVSEEAVRTTLTRMVKRELLARHRRGRRMYFGLTARSTAVLEDGYQRVWRSVVNRDWDGTWTMVGFSLPESARSQRHDLRSRLIWGGFGTVQNGLWIAPGEVDVPGLVGDLELDDHLRVFTVRTAKPTEAGQIAHSAFDLPAVAARYQAFLRRWDGDNPYPDAPDDLARQLLLHTEWLHLVRRDPRLPAEHLPGDWPAIRAEQVFRRLAEGYGESARTIAESVLDTIRP
ncbi:PaaX family transcriptional regulator [Planosporangium mesophilum]|uniref:PaaX family transcriptional regulator n=1 Tax=Planosporangium mesophilum TaxID=689768 RepID=A0A8J3THE5_9ACTN|nr:PaaX family transcriptional regulator C-terminal domain-containing protein [Planosporangium mesophilum]GII25651.1 PaaX family transcriptional regulator [Planosporangium mesophilum]